EDHPDDPDERGIGIPELGETARDTREHSIIAGSEQPAAHRQPPWGSSVKLAAAPSTVRSINASGSAPHLVPVPPLFTRPRSSRLWANVSWSVRWIRRGEP